MSNGPRRGARRGRRPTPVQPEPATANYVEAVPAGDRYNLAFHARYQDTEVLLREVDTQFFRFYHVI